MPKLITTSEAAAALDITERGVRKIAEKLGLPRLGRQFIITAKDLEKMRNRDSKPGPKGPRK